MKISIPNHKIWGLLTYVVKSSNLQSVTNKQKWFLNINLFFDLKKIKDMITIKLGMSNKVFKFMGFMLQKL